MKKKLVFGIGSLTMYVEKVGPKMRRLCKSCNERPQKMRVLFLVTNNEQGWPDSLCYCGKCAVELLENGFLGGLREKLGGDWD